MSTPLDLPRLPERFEPRGVLSNAPFERSVSAYDTLLRREVVLKLPGRTAWAGWSITVRDRLLREARALAKVRHDVVARALQARDVPAVWLRVLVDPDQQRQRSGRR